MQAIQMCTFFLVPLLSLCERWKLNGGPRGSLSHAEQRGNVEPSGRRHPDVADPSAGSVRGGGVGTKGSRVVTFCLFFPS